MPDEFRMDVSVGPCPRCRCALTPATYGPLELGVCLPCGGAWLLRGSMDRLRSAGPHIVRRLGEKLQPDPLRIPRAHSGTLACPTCPAPLAAMIDGSGVQVEVCAYCEGVWLTCYALIRLSVALDAAPPPPAPSAASASRSGPGSRVSSPAADRPAVASRSSAAAAMQPCANCGESNSPGAAVCWACGKALVARRVSGCPRCSSGMVESSIAGTSLNACPGCGGVFVTPARLNILLAHCELVQPVFLEGLARAHGRACVNTTERYCPFCRAAMFRGPVGSLCRQPVDTCPQCFGLFIEYPVFRDLLPRTAR